MRDFGSNKSIRLAKSNSARGDSRRTGRSALGAPRHAPRQNTYTFFMCLCGKRVKGCFAATLCADHSDPLLPFVTVSCGQYELETVRVVDFQTTELVEDEEFGGRTVALLLVILAPLGLILGLWKGGRGASALPLWPAPGWRCSLPCRLA